MIRPHALRLIVSRLFTVPVLVLGAGLEKSKITELAPVKSLCGVTYWGWSEPAANNAPVEDEVVQAV